jgi:hypothetical protein
MSTLSALTLVSRGKDATKSLHQFVVLIAHSEARLVKARGERTMMLLPRAGVLAAISDVTFEWLVAEREVRETEFRLLPKHLPT